MDVFEAQALMYDRVAAIEDGHKAVLQIESDITNIHFIRMHVYDGENCPMPPSWGRVGKPCTLKFHSFDGMIITTTCDHTFEVFNNPKSPSFPIEWLPLSTVELEIIFRAEAIEEKKRLEKEKIHQAKVEEALRQYQELQWKLARDAETQAYNDEYFMMNRLDYPVFEDGEFDDEF